MPEFFFKPAQPFLSNSAPPSMAVRAGPGMGKKILAQEENNESYHNNKNGRWGTNLDLCR